MLEPCWMMRDPEHVCANPLIFILVKWGSWCVEAHLTEGSEAEGQLSPWARCHWVEESAQVLLFGGPQHQWLPAVQFCFFKPYCLLELFYWRDKTLNLTYRICTPRITTKSIQFSKGGGVDFGIDLETPELQGINLKPLEVSISPLLLERDSLMSQKGMCVLKNSIGFYV